MADQAYNIFRRLLGGPTAQPPGIDYLADDIRAYLIDRTQYTFDVTHEYLSAIPVGARVAFGTLTDKTVEANGAWNAEPLVIPSVTGPTFHEIVMVKWVTDATDSILLVRLDSYGDLPAQPNSGQVTVRWPTDSNKILRP